MSITILNYMDSELVTRVQEQAAARTKAAEQAAESDFAAVLADTQKAAAAQETEPSQTAAADTAVQTSSQTSASSSYVSEDLDAIFQEAADTYGVSSALLKSIAKAESNFNASAVSRAGAVGIMQLMPATAAALGVSNSYDARENIMGGANYISQLLSRYQGNVSYALAAYNAGSENVDSYGGIPPFTETQNYVKKVLSYMEEFGSSVSSTASSLFHLTGSARDEANQMLANFFDSKNISKDALDILTLILKLKNMTTSTTSSDTLSNAQTLFQTITNTTETVKETAQNEPAQMAVSVVSSDETVESFEEFPMRGLSSND